MVSMVDELERERLIRERMEKSKIPRSLAIEIVDIYLGLSTGDVVFIYEDNIETTNHRNAINKYLGIKDENPAPPE